MPIPKINFNVPILSMIRKNGWTQKVGHGLGRLWSLWTHTFNELIQRVRSATRGIFASFQKKPSATQNKPVITSPPNNVPPIQIPPVSQQPPIENIENQVPKPEAESIDLKDLFSEQEKPFAETTTVQEQPKIETTLVNPVPLPIPVVEKPTESQVQNQNADSHTENRTIEKAKALNEETSHSTSTEKPLESHQAPKADSVEINKIEIQTPTPLILKLKNQEVLLTKVGKQELETEENFPLQPETEFRRRRKQKNSEMMPSISILNIPTSELGLPTLINPQITPPLKQTTSSEEVEYTLIEAGGGGDCQLHAILKGLEMQYPHLLKYKEKDNTWVSLTSQKLRSLGVEFAREQIDHYGSYVKKVLAYLDADRKEYNNELIDLVKKQFKEDRANLNQALEKREISEADYKQKRKALADKYTKLIDDLKKKIIHTDADFLKQLGQPGFYCSTLHLLALSAKFKIPIQVHLADGVKGYEFQKFNPSKSTQSPIHLYRAGRHYQLKLYLPKEKTLTDKN